jgi:hypothetical protein
MTYLEDRRLPFDAAGVLAHMEVALKRGEVPTVAWLIERTPGRGTAVRTVMRLLKTLEYVQSNRVGPGPAQVSVRFDLEKDFQVCGQKPQAAAKSRSTVSKLIEVKEVKEIVVAELVEAEIEIEILEPTPEILLTAISRATKRKKAVDLKVILSDKRFVALSDAYKQMLRLIEKPNNFGDRDAAARSFRDLLPLIEMDPGLIELILRSLPGYAKTAGNYPKGLGKFLKEKLWEDIPKDLDATTWTGGRYDEPDAPDF